MTKPFTTAFAESGDVMFIPEGAQPDGSVSYETGFGPDYSKDPLENGAKPVPRKGHNELFFQITGSIGDIQRQGAADWYPEFAADGGYPKNAIVWDQGDRWKSQIDGNATRPNIDEIAWLPSSKFEGGGGGGGGDFGLTGPTTIAVGGAFQYKISPYSSFMTYAVSATNGTATISGDTITLTIAAGETANVTDLTVIRSDGVRNDFRIAIGAQSIAKPVMLSPATGSVDVALGPNLTASAFQTYPDGADTHLNTDWRIRTMAGAVVWQSLANATNKTNIKVPDNTLPLNTQLQADVRYRGTTLPVSAWSDVVVFTTTNQSILTPTITSPLNGATGIGETPTFVASAFATNPAGADTHASSDWRLKNSSSVIIWSSTANTVDKTAITLPNGVLATASQYTMEVRYNGSILQPSQWSPVVSFTTAATFDYGKYATLGGGGAPYITTYGQNIDTLVKLAAPASPPPTVVAACDYSGDGKYFACGFSDPPYVAVYKRSGDSLVRGAFPSSHSTSPNSITFNYESNLLVISSAGGSLSAYSRSGEVFSAAPTSSLFSPAPTNISLVYFGATSETLWFLEASTRILGYKRSGSMYNQFTSAELVDRPSALATTSDGVYLAAMGQGMAQMFKRVGDSLVELAFPSSPGGLTGACFSRDGIYLACSASAAPYIHLYKRSGDTFAKLANPSTLPTGSTSGVRFSRDGTYVILSSTVTPFVYNYKRAGDALSKLANPASLPAGAALCLSNFPKTLGVDV